MSDRMLIAALTCAFAAQAAAAEGGACRLAEIDPAQPPAAAGLAFSLGDADDASRPTAWQGPLTVKRSGHKDCTLEPQVGILSRPFLYDASGRLFVSTYSGSNSQVELLDLDRCQVVWVSQRFAGVVTLQKGRIHAGRQVWRTGPNCMPSKR